MKIGSRMSIKRKLQIELDALVLLQQALGDYEEENQDSEVVSKAVQMLYNAMQAVLKSQQNPVEQLHGELVGQLGSYGAHVIGMILTEKVISPEPDLFSFDAVNERLLDNLPRALGPLQKQLINALHEVVRQALDTAPEPGMYSIDFEEFPKLMIVKPIEGKDIV